jgi:hypothetical protein
MAETEAGSSSGKLVGDAVNRLRTGRLASEGLHKYRHTTTQADLQVNGGLLLDVIVSKSATCSSCLPAKS